MRRYRESSSDYIKQAIEEVMTFRECATCHGKRLKPEVLAVKIADQNIADVERHEHRQRAGVGQWPRH